MKFEILAATSCLMWGMGVISEASGQGVPANDSFSAPTLVGELPAILTGSNQGSTLELGEPKPSTYEDAVEASVWFEWTAPKNGTFRIDSVGSDFSTAIAVWTGDQFANLVELESDDNISYYKDDDVAVAIQAIEGTTYRISLYGSREKRGNYVLRIFEGGSLSGTILGPDGSTPVQNHEVTLFQWSDTTSKWESIYYENISTRPISDANGQYRFIGLDEGYYKVTLYNPNSEMYEYWPGIPNTTASGVIRVDRGVAAEGFNFTLDSIVPSGSISGRVTGVNGATSMRKVRVDAYTYSAFIDQWLVCGTTRTYDDGTYTITGLPAGTYRIGFATEMDPKDFSAYFYGNSQTVEDAADIILEDDAATMPDIDGNLPLATMLSGIELSDGALRPAFNPALLTYGAQVSEQTDSIAITPHMDSSRYTMRINGSFVPSGSASAPLPLTKGSNLITIEVNKDGGESLRTYSILVTRGMLQKASLKSLVLDGGNLKPRFAPDTTVYTVDVGENTSSITVQPTGVRNALVSVNGKPVPDTGEGVKVALKTTMSTIDVAVTNASGKSETIYRIIVTRERSSDSRLDSLVIKGKKIHMTPSRFSPGRLQYKIQASTATKSILIIPKPSFKGALVTINGRRVRPSERWFNTGEKKTVFHIVVIAQDGSRKTYRLTVLKP